MFLLILWNLMVEIEATKKACETLEVSTKYEIRQAQKTIKQSQHILALAA